VRDGEVDQFLGRPLHAPVAFVVGGLIRARRLLVKPEEVWFDGEFGSTEVHRLSGKTFCRTVRALAA
jgi:hypothetical protein